MCDMCDPETGAPTHCPDCARMICFDIEAFDDISAPAYVTLAGDVFCSRCGRGYDEDHERDDSRWDYYPYSWHDPDLPMDDEESTGKYIGPESIESGE